MEQYTTVTRRINEITGNNKMIDALVFTYIKSRINYKTYIASNVTEKEMANHLGLSIDTVENIIPRIKKHKFLFDKVEQDEEKEIGSYKTYNKYYLVEDSGNFFFIYNSFFNDTINIADFVDRCKVKGLLLHIKSVCIKETNKYISKRPNRGGLNKSELAKKLGIDIKTLTKYLQLAIEVGLIKLIPNGLLITNKSIIPDFYSEDSLTKTYHYIYDWCLDNGITPPERNDTIITNADGTITRRNWLLMEIAYKLDGKDIHSWLTNRITKKPEELSLEYIATMLNIHICKETMDYDITL